MPDWSYGPLFKPILFRLPAERARDLTLGALGRLAGRPGGAAVIAFLGHMEPPSSLRRTVAGLDCASPVGLGAGLDVVGTAARALARFELGFLELGPVTREPVTGTTPIERRTAQCALVYPDAPVNPGLGVLLGKLRAQGSPRVPLGVRLAHRPGADAAEAATERAALIAALAPHVAFFTLDCRAVIAGDWSETAWAAHLGATVAAVAAHGSRPLFLCLPPDAASPCADRLVEVGVGLGVAGVVVTGGVREGADRRLLGAPTRERCRQAVGRLRARWGERIAIIGGDGVMEPGDALALLAAGADLVQVHSGLVYGGPGLPKRINEALIRSAPQRRTPESPWRPGLLGLLLLGLGMIVGGILAWLIAATRVVLPYDEAFVGLTRAQLLAANPRLLPFMAHDRITLAGTMLSIGVLYAGLAWGGVRRGHHWAWAAICASAAFGFPTFFLFVGFVYFDPLHALVSLALLPFLLVGARWGQPRGTPDYGPVGLGLRNDRAWRRGVFGQLCFILLGVGLGLGGLMIALTGITQVFVPSDLAFIGADGPSLREISPRLVPLVAHDRAGFGGALVSNAIGVLLAGLWGIRPGARWLWWTLLLAGLPGFGATLAIHYIVGYTDPLHIAPVWLAALLYLLGLGFTHRFTATVPEGRASSHPSNEVRAQVV